MYTLLCFASMFYMQEREIIFSAGGFHRNYRNYRNRKILTVGERINFWDHGIFLFPPTQKHFSSLEKFLERMKKNSYGYKFLKDCL